MKTTSRLVLLTVAFVLIFVSAIPGLTQEQITTQEKIDQLLADYDAALDYELQYGETIVVTDPVDGEMKLLTGSSQEKMDALWDDVDRQIEELLARPTEERANAVQLIQSLSIDTGNVTYLDVDRTLYNQTSQLERYQTDNFIYSIDIQTNQIIEIVPIDTGDSAGESYSLSQAELEQKAKDIIYKVTNGLNVSLLTPSFGDKQGITFFFRWEDRSKTLNDGMVPFIQVGLSSEGKLLNFVNTLPFARQ